MKCYKPGSNASPELQAAYLKTCRAKETPLVELVIEYIARDSLAICWRQSIGGRQKTRMGRPGQADISGILSNGRRIEIECKKKGESQSPAQAQFEKMIIAMGGVYMLTDDFDDFRRRWVVLRLRTLRPRV